MEYGGKVCIECAKTGYKTDMEFKLKVSIHSSTGFITAFFCRIRPYVISFKLHLTLADVILTQYTQSLYIAMYSVATLFLFG